MFLKDLRLGRSWAIGVFALIASPCTRATNGFFTIAPLGTVSRSQSLDIFLQTILRFLIMGKMSAIGPITEISTDLQFKHAFPRCNGGGGEDLD